MSRCRSCGADVLFARTSKNSALAPFEGDAQDGDHVIIHGKAERYEPLLHQGHRRYISHFARCPQAQKWRR